jgi:hypothetical protein
MWTLLLLALSASPMANILPGPIPKLPGGIVFSDLPPDTQDCVLQCAAEYYAELAQCGFPGLFCRIKALTENNACVANCLHDSV